MAKIINEVGKTYGYLTVIKRGENTKDNRAVWICKCKCGNIVETTGKSLRNGHVQSCGCLAKERLIQRNIERGGGDLTGQRFGKLTVINFDSWITHPNGKRSRLWKCKCDCGNICFIQHQYLRYGDTESCGCIKSRGNATIMRWLNENHYKYESEYSFKDLLSPKNTPYKYDFAIFNEDDSLKCLIEYQGNIHFEIGSGWNNKEALEDCQRRDKIKYDYCIDKKIKLHYITYKEIIEDRLKEILNE